MFLAFVADGIIGCVNFSRAASIRLRFSMICSIFPSSARKYNAFPTAQSNSQTFFDAGGPISTGK
jgi:hypothetical protein